MRATVNGEPLDLPEGLTVAALLQRLGVQGDRVAVERNGEVVKKARHGEQTLAPGDRKSTRLNSSHLVISYAVFCLKKKKKRRSTHRTGSSRETTRSTTSRRSSRRARRRNIGSRKSRRSSIDHCSHTSPTHASTGLR